jgi:multicomponent K+:H+ antiporter subunit C
MTELVLALCIAVLFGCGVFLLLRPRTFSIILGFSLLSYGVNLLLFSSGGVLRQAPPVLPATPGTYDQADPLPQALVLTAIVIGLAMSAFVVALALKMRGELGNDDVDAEQEGGP